MDLKMHKRKVNGITVLLFEGEVKSYLACYFENSPEFMGVYYHPEMMAEEEAIQRAFENKKNGLFRPWKTDSQIDELLKEKASQTAAAAQGAKNNVQNQSTADQAVCQVPTEAKP